MEDNHDKLFGFGLRRLRSRCSLEISRSLTAGSGDARRGGFMQRFLTFVVLAFLTVPVGLSIQGCANKNSTYCNGSGYGYNNTQPVSISLQPQTTGLSVAFSQTSQLQAPTSQNCKGGTASVKTYTYGTSDRTIADVSPTGAVCGGTWNLHYPRGRRLHHLPSHRQDRHRVHDRQRRRVYQQPGRGVFPPGHHQPFGQRPDQPHQWASRRVSRRA